MNIPLEVLFNVQGTRTASRTRRGFPTLQIAFQGLSNNMPDFR